MSEGHDDKDLAIVAVVVIAVVYGVSAAVNGQIGDAYQLARDCILVLGSVATGKALSK